MIADGRHWICNVCSVALSSLLQACVACVQCIVWCFQSAARAVAMDRRVVISELADSRIARVEDVVTLGDVIWVKCIGKDQHGRAKLSRKAAMRERELGGGA
jgi:hypothetical protein